MATNIIMPALEMAQETGRLVSWLKHDGDTVAKGEPIMEIETDKVTVEIGAPEAGILGGILVKENDVVQVGKTIGWILQPGETPPSTPPIDLPTGRTTSTIAPTESKPIPLNVTTPVDVSPVARKMAEENGIDLSSLKSNGKRIGKADVMAYLRDESGKTPAPGASVGVKDEVSAIHPSSFISHPSRVLASPKARRLASERGLDLKTVSGSGPDGAVLASDVENFKLVVESKNLETPGQIWRVMAEHMSASWTTVPHFYLIREVDAGNLVEWRKRITPTVEKRTNVKPTYTDLLVKLIGIALRDHPRLNASWIKDGIQWNEEINVGIATAVDDGLIVPVIHHADKATVSEIAAQRQDLIERAREKKLRPTDVSDGTFTLTNLGMYGVDAFNAIVNTPQAAILSVGRIADRVVPVNGQVVIRPMMVVTLSLDHRVVDGARAAPFLGDLANLIEDPWKLLA